MLHAKLFMISVSVNILIPYQTTAESIEEKPHRRSQIRMAIRLVQYAPLDIQQTEAPRFRLEKHFLLREGALEVDAGLDRQWYTQGSPINVSLHIHNRSSRIVKKIQVLQLSSLSQTLFFPLILPILVSYPTLVSPDFVNTVPLKLASLDS